MSTTVPGGEGPADPAVVLGEELAKARNRGLDGLDVEWGDRHVVVVPLLEGLARTYCDDWSRARGPLIRRLLIDGLAWWQDEGQDDEVGLVRRLFFAPEGTKPADSRPGRLMDAAREASGMSSTYFEKHRRAVFRMFAQHLLDAVEQGARAAPPPPPAAATPASARRQGRARWPFITGAAAVAVLIVVLVLGLPGGSSSTPPAAGSVSFRFDALGGGSPIIRVFPGVSEAPSDEVPNGTFKSGDVVAAICQTTGRSVPSDPAAGELPRQSDKWVRIVGSPGQTQYARLTYGDMTPEDFAGLPPCGSAS